MKTVFHCWSFLYILAKLDVDKRDSRKKPYRMQKNARLFFSTRKGMSNVHIVPCILLMTVLAIKWMITAIV